MYRSKEHTYSFWKLNHMSNRSISRYTSDNSSYKRTLRWSLIGWKWILEQCVTAHELHKQRIIKNDAFHMLAWLLISKIQWIPSNSETTSKQLRWWYFKFYFRIAFQIQLKSRTQSCWKNTYSLKQN